MIRKFTAFLLLLACSVLPLRAQKTVVFWQPGFPTAESQPMTRETLDEVLRPTFAGLDDLSDPKALSEADLLVLPYGSAFPMEAWKAIQDYLGRGGNLLTVGGRPLTVPVRRAPEGFRAERPQNAWSRHLGITHTYEAPHKDFRGFAWDAGYDFLPKQTVRAQRAFVVTSEGRGNYRGLGYLLDSRGWKVAAPVTRMDFLDHGGRCVFLNFEPEAGFWSSPQGRDLLRTVAAHARQGAAQLWLEMNHASVLPGEQSQVVVHLRRGSRRPMQGRINVELLAGSKIKAQQEIAVSGQSVRENILFPDVLTPGYYTVRGFYQGAAGVEEAYHTGFWVRDERLLRTGEFLRVAGDYFDLGGKPMFLYGVNYFSTDVYNTGFFVGGSAAGNAYVWRRDFAEMAQRGVNFVRTGTWHNHTWYLDRVTGSADERFLRAIEAFLLSAAKGGIQVQYTFFSFDPQTIQRRGQSSLATHPGTNPYTDPVSVAAQKRYLLSIVHRFKDVPFLCWDLINEPSFSNPATIFRGNAPNADPTEIAAWNRWLERRYKSPAKLAEAWNVTELSLSGFGAIPLPEPADLGVVRYGNARLVRALDYNLFAQDMFKQWAAEMVAAIRSTGSRQMVTVGQDEGGVTNRLLNHFYADAGVDFTVNHTWWRDDALLWDSVVAKRPDKPNLIGETGPQPVWRMDSSWRWDEPNVLPLFERKMALGFAAGNAGSLHWDWSRSDTFSILRRDGSYKSWMDAFTGIGEFVKKAAPYARNSRPPEIAIVLPQSLQLSVFNNYALEAQQHCVRALYHYARASAYAVGEYQIHLLGAPKLILLPSPWVLREESWQALLAKVRAGSTLLVTGRLDADEHFHATEHLKTLGLSYQPALLTARENLVEWPGGQAVFRFSGDKTTYLERGQLADGSTFAELPVAQGKILYVPLPIELAANEEATGRVYRYALQRAGVRPLYTTDMDDPGILICPTSLEEGTLYVLTSESGTARHVAFRDAASGKELGVDLRPGRAALLLVLRNGDIAARYESGQ